MHSLLVACRCNFQCLCNGVHCVCLLFFAALYAYLSFFGVYSLLISRMQEVVSFSIQVCIVRVGFAVQYVSSLPLCVCAFLGCFLVALPNNCVGCQWYLFLASLPPYLCALFWLLLLFLLLHFAGRHCVLHLRGFSCHCWHVALCRGPAIILCRVAICFILLFRVCTVSIVTLISTYAWPAEQCIVSSIVSTMLYGLPAGLCFFRLAQCCMGYLPDYVVSSLYC